MKFKIYLAGPITNMSYKEATTWREAVRPLISPEIAIYSPMRGCRYLEGMENIPAVQVQNDQITMSSNRGIMVRDMNDCLTSDALLIYYPENSPPSIGTAMEIAWAHMKNIPVVAVGPEGNINRIHPMISEAVLWVPTLEQACMVINSILLPE